MKNLHHENNAMNANNQPQNGLMVIKASAGSGKTYTLAKLYIEQLLLRPSESGKMILRHRPDYHKHILAITFTNKATDEMKRRIVKELYQLAQDIKESDYYSYFAERCEPDAFNGLQQAAQEALNSILLNYSTFMVSTIDSFFQSILRNFARELDHDYNYEVQIDQDYATKIAVRNFLMALGRDHERTGKKTTTAIEKWVMEFIRINMQQSSDWNFFAGKALTEFAENINSELFRNHLKSIRTYLSKKDDEEGKVVTDLSKIQRFVQLLIKGRNHYKTRYTTLYTDRMADIMQRHNIPVTNLHKKWFLLDFLYAGAMASGKDLNDACRQPTNEKLLKQFTGKFVPSDDALAEITTLCNELTADYDRWQLLDSMINDVGLLGLLGAIDDKLEEYRKDTNTILIADTNELIYRLIGSPRDKKDDNKKNNNDDTIIPFIYERTGTWINHYMIDEFQDTSRKQYDNFLPLLKDSLSNGLDNFNMIIGDSKQSIYRFRNADPSLFRDAIDLDFSNQPMFQDTLPTNYRSARAVVDFNNALFELIVNHYAPAGNSDAVADIVRRTYMPTGELSDFQQKKHITDPQGLVCVITKDTAGMILKEAQQVLDMLPDYLLELHQRYDWRHIGILVNTKAEGADIVARLLEHNHQSPADKQINVMSDESMLLRSAPTVRRVISILRFIDLVQYHHQEELEDEEEEQLEESIKSFANKKRLSNQRLNQALSKFIAKLAKTETTDAQIAGDILDETFNELPSEKEMPLEELMDKYADELKRLLPPTGTNALTLNTIIEHVLSCIMDESSKKDTAFLLELQSCANQFTMSSPGGTVREFLRYWDQHKDSLTVAATSTGNSITVLTIHKSKGMEFDCVILPFVKWEIATNSQEHIYWMPKDYWLEDGCGAHLFDDVTNAEYDDDIVPPLLPMRRKKLENFTDGGFGKFVVQQQSNTLIDNLNKTYVAFTRPKEELHIFAYNYDPNKSPANENAGQLVGRLAPDVPKIVKNENGWLQLGAPRTIHKTLEEKQQEAEMRKKKEKEGKKLDEPPTPIDMPPYHVSPSPGVVRVKLPREVTASASEGIRIHDMLSRIKYPSDAPKALRQAQYHGIIGQPGCPWSLQDAQKLLEQLFTQPETTAWWAEDNVVYSERNLEGFNDNKNKRPDRIVRRPDGTIIIIDYKTGRPHHKDIEQVNKYMERMRLLGHKRVEGYLLYINPEEPYSIIPVNNSSSL